MLIKLNFFSIKINIYEDTASIADLLVFCKQADFLLFPPSCNPHFTARLLHLSYTIILGWVFSGTRQDQFPTNHSLLVPASSVPCWCCRFILILSSHLALP